MDTFTRRYLAFLGVLALLGLVWWLSSIDYRARELNQLLAKDPALSAYPYQFRVLSLDNGVAAITSPRSSEVSVIQGLRILFPELQDASPVSEAMMEAQTRLARMQSRAASLVTGENDVEGVKWVLDRRWLTNNGVQLEAVAL